MLERDGRSHRSTTANSGEVESARNIVPREEISDRAGRNIDDAYSLDVYPVHPPRSTSEEKWHDDNRRLSEDDEDDDYLAALISISVDKGVLQTI